MMNQHKYKIKLQPGPIKRGKAKKIARDLFIAVGRGSETQLMLIKSMTDQEMMDSLPITSKLVAPGIGKLA